MHLKYVVVVQVLRTVTGHMMVNLYLMTLLCLICIDQIQAMHHVINAQIIPYHIKIMVIIAVAMYNIIPIALVTVRLVTNHQTDYHHVSSVALVVVHIITILGVEIVSSHTPQDQMYVTAFKGISVLLVMIMMVLVKSALLVLRQ